MGTALRQGARSVTSLEIAPRPPVERPASWPWPTFPRLFKVSSSHEEGGEVLYSTSTVEFVSDGSAGGRRLSHLRIAGVEFDGGRPVPIPGTERLIPAQLALLAMGFVGVPSRGIPDQLGLEVDSRARISRNEDFSTPVPGVFVAGDAGRGQSLVVWAIAEGRGAAASVDAYLRGASSLPSPVKSGDVSLTP